MPTHVLSPVSVSRVPQALSAPGWGGGRELAVHGTDVVLDSGMRIAKNSTCKGMDTHLGGVTFLFASPQLMMLLWGWFLAG